MKELVLYGKRKDRMEDWHEELLLTNAIPETIKRVKVLAAKNGFESFRVAEIDLSTPPDFIQTLSSDLTEECAKCGHTNGHHSAGMDARCMFHGCSCINFVSVGVQNR